METAVKMSVSRRFWLVEIVTPKSGKTRTDVAHPTPIPDILLSRHSIKLAVFDCDIFHPPDCDVSELHRRCDIFRQLNMVFFENRNLYIAYFCCHLFYFTYIRFTMFK
jgi:hypothetical protein